MGLVTLYDVVGIFEAGDAGGVVVMAVPVE